MSKVLDNNDFGQIFTLLPLREKEGSDGIKLSLLKEGYLVYRSKRISLISGEEQQIDALFLIRELQTKTVSDKFEHYQVLHLFYEFSDLLEQVEALNDETCLAIVLVYGQKESIKLPACIKDIPLKQRQSQSFTAYAAKFKRAKRHLEKGDCYQLNLTNDFDFSFSSQIIPLDFIAKLWHKKNDRGFYGHATWLPAQSKLYLCNTPELLFRYENPYLSSYPIKGTMPLGRLGINKTKCLLKHDKKNQAELYMITDLVSNDLTKIGPFASQVRAKKQFLQVPGLLHLFSHIRVELEKSTNLWQILSALFPGGSITGAPKLRVRKILGQLEKRQRGFYTGSSVFMGPGLLLGTINIRGAEIDFKQSTLRYGAGGGLTLRSQARDEYRELQAKMKSFINLLRE